MKITSTTKHYILKTLQQNFNTYLWENIFDRICNVLPPFLYIIYNLENIYYKQETGMKVNCADNIYLYTLLNSHKIFTLFVKKNHWLPHVYLVWKSGPNLKLCELGHNVIFTAAKDSSRCCFPFMTLLMYRFQISKSCHICFIGLSTISWYDLISNLSLDSPTQTKLSMI